MVEPLATSGLAIASGLLGALADLRGLGVPHFIGRLTQRFAATPDDTPLFFRATWLAAVQATYGCVQQVFEYTDVSDEVRGDLKTWNHYRSAHQRLRKMRGWGRNADLPQQLERVLTDSLAQVLQDLTGSNVSADPAECMWMCYCEALRITGYDSEPPEVIRQAFYGQRSEEKVWPWFKHFRLRMGERLRSDVGFKAMFDTMQFADISDGIERLIAECEVRSDALVALSDKFDHVQESIERTEQNIVDLMDGQQKLQDLVDKLVASDSSAIFELNKKIESLQKRPEIRIEDLVGWMQSAFGRDIPLPLDELPRLLEQALTVDLPNLRRQAEAYHLDPLASAESQALLEEARLLLQPQLGRPLDLEGVKRKLKKLDDTIVIERTERRLKEDRELAELRVLRADAERATANYYLAAELMEQAVSLNKDGLLVHEWTRQAGFDWYRHGELHPGVASLERSILLLKAQIDLAQTDHEKAGIQMALGTALGVMGQRTLGENGIKAINESIVFYLEALKIYENMPIFKAVALGNLGNAYSTLGERMQDDKGTGLLRTAVEYNRAAGELFSENGAALDQLIAQSNLGNALSVLSRRLNAKEALQTLREAETCFRNCLSARTKEIAPAQWGMCQLNLGATYLVIADMVEGREKTLTINKSIDCYRSALEIHTEDMPLDWARTHYGLGSALLALGEQTDSINVPDALKRAESHFEIAANVLSKDLMPLDWAGIQINLGNVKYRIGARAEGAARVNLLCNAADHFEKAQEIFVQESDSSASVDALLNLASVKLEISDHSAGHERIKALIDAISIYDRILSGTFEHAMPRQRQAAFNGRAHAMGFLTGHM